MCRHLAYLGPSAPLRETLFDAPHSLRAQARAPRLQVYGDDNPDGFGVGWYPPGATEPERYQSLTPIWEDDAFAAAAATTEGEVMVAAARLASPGSPVELAGVAPFTAEGWLCSLNGMVEGFHDGVGDELRARLPAERRAAIRSAADTEVCFHRFLSLLSAPDRGATSTPARALRRLVAELESVAGGPFNFLLTDGKVVVATAVGNSLFVRCEPKVIASEPLDDGPGWSAVPDRSLVVADRAGLEVTPL